MVSARRSRFATQRRSDGRPNFLILASSRAVSHPAADLDADLAAIVPGEVWEDSGWGGGRQPNDPGQWVLRIAITATSSSTLSSPSPAAMMRLQIVSASWSLRKAWQTRSKRSLHPLSLARDRSATLDEAIGVEHQRGALLEEELVALALSVWVDTEYQARRDLLPPAPALAAAGNERWWVPGGADEQGVEGRLGHGIDDRRCDPALEVTQLAIQSGQHFGRVLVLERIRAKCAAQTSHDHCGSKAVAFDVAHDQADLAAGKHEDVVPVAAEIALGGQVTHGQVEPLDVVEAQRVAGSAGSTSAARWASFLLCSERRCPIPAESPSIRATSPAPNERSLRLPTCRTPKRPSGP